MTTTAPLVSVVVPVFNEALVLPDLVDRLATVAAGLQDRYRFEFVFVDDGSTDDSSAVCVRLAGLEPRVRVVSLRRNYGQTAALQTGFEQALGTVVVSMDGDLQHFPEDIPLFLEKLEQGYDVVCGWRRTRQEGVLRRWPSRVANWMLRWVSGVGVHDIGTTFRAYRADVVHELSLLGENHRFIPIFARTMGASLAEVEIRNIDRPTGRSSYGLSRTLDVFLDMFFLGFYVHYLDRPIRLFGRIAVAAIAAAVVITMRLGYLFLVYRTPVVREHSGWFLLALMFYISGVQFLLFGVVSEVLVRIYFYPRRHRPYPSRAVRDVGPPATE